MDEYLPLLGAKRDGVEGDHDLERSGSVMWQLRGGGKGETKNSSDPHGGVSRERQSGSNGKFNATNIPDHLRKPQWDGERT